MVAPAKMPGEMVRRLNVEVGAVLRNREVVDKFREQLTVATPSTPQEYREWMHGSLERGHQAREDYRRVTGDRRVLHRLARIGPDHLRALGEDEPVGRLERDPHFLLNLG